MANIDDWEDLPVGQEDDWEDLPVKEEKRKEEEEELVGEITAQELSGIATKHNLSPEQLKELESNIAFFGTQVKGKEQSLLEQAPGFIADAVGLGIPQKYIIETADTEEMKNALDDLRQLAESRKSGLRTAAEIGTGFLVPGGAAVKAAKLGAKAAKAAQTAALVGTPAVEMAARAKRGEELEAAAIGAAAGGVLGIAAPKIIKAASKLKSKKLQESIQKQLDEMPAVEEKLDARMTELKPKLDIERKALKGERLSQEEMKQWLGEDIISKLPRQTPAEIEELAEAKLISVFEDFEKFTKKEINQLEREGEEFMLRQYDRFIKDKLADEAIAAESLKGRLVPITGLKALLLKFSDNKPLAKIMDARLGTNIERTLDDMSKKHNLYTVGLGDSLENLQKLRVLTRKKGVNEEELYKALDTGAASKISPEILSQWKQFFEGQRKLAIEMGMPIQKLKNYVPKRRLSLAKYLSAIKRKAEDIEKLHGHKLNELTPEDFAFLKKKKEFQPLLSEVIFNSGKKSIDDALTFNEEFNRIIHNPGHVRSKLSIDAFATKAREGKIPDFVLDKQVGNLASKWLQGTFRTVALRDGIEELKRASGIAKKAGDMFTAKHLNDLVEDIIGSRSDTFGKDLKDLGNKIITFAQIKADKATNKFNKKVWEGLADSPLMMNMIMRQIYPNYLGMNPKSVLQNLASPATFIVPDMGTGYGGAKYLQGMIKLAATKTQGQEIKLSSEMARKLGRPIGSTYKTRNMNLILQNEGLLPQQWTGEMVDALQEGLKAGGMGDATRKVLDWQASKAMYLFEKSEIIARSSAYFMGKQIGTDIIKNPEWAKGFISKIDSPSYQKALSRAIENKNEAGAQKLMMDFINSNNMFNYDRINMSAYGRYMGPLFSVFSKWPTSIAGRVLSDIERRGAVKGVARNARTLMMPFAALAFVDALTQQEDSDLYNRVIGQGGLRAWTAADSLSPLFQEGIGKTPAGQSLQAFVDAATKDRGSFRKAINDTFNTYMPGSGWLRFMGEDVPIYRGRAKPAGPKIERRLKEMEKLIK